MVRKKLTLIPKIYLGKIRGLVETEIISVTTFFLILFFVLTKNYLTINEYLLDSTVISTNGNVDFGTFEEPPSSNSFF